MKLRYTRRAARQLDNVLAYIEKQSPEGAASVMDRIEASIALIQKHPRVGSLIGKRDMCRIVINPFPYLVFYRAAGDEAIIHGIRQAAGKPGI